VARRGHFVRSRGLIASKTAAVAGRNPAASEVVLGRFVLQRSGIVFWMHPTEARITITATAGGPLKVCEVGRTFSTYWTGGCHRLGRGPLLLPTSGGAVHVGLQIGPLDGGVARVKQFLVRWHCVDHFFAFGRGTTRVGAPRPIFDC
jgi:hypothetical protein